MQILDAGIRVARTQIMVVRIMFARGITIITAPIIDLVKDRDHVLTNIFISIIYEFGKTGSFITESNRISRGTRCL